MSELGTYAGRLVKHAGIYALGPAITLMIGILSIAFLTRLLSPSDYGRVAVLIVFASALTLVYNLSSFQGSNRAGFSTSDSDLVPVGDEPAGGGGGDEDPARADRQRRVALGTGIVLTGLVGGLGTLVVAAFAERIGRLLLGSGSYRVVVIWAAAEGAMAAAWRLTANIPRLERRPAVWLIVQSSRPLLALAASVALIHAGYGLDGAIVGWFVGTTVSLGLALTVARRSIRLAFNPRAIIPIYRGGAEMVPAAIGFWIMGNADILIVSRYAAATKVGMYRVGARVGAMASPLSTSFVMAWGTLAQEPVYLAARRRHAENADRTVIAYFCMAAGAVILGMTVFRGALVAIASHRFAAAAPLIPILAIRWPLRGLFQIAYRQAEYEKKRRDFGFVALAAGFVFLAASILLGRRYGMYGVAAATPIGPLAGFLTMLGLARLHGRFPPLDYARLLGVTLLTAACCVASVRVAPSSSPLFGCAWIAAYVVLLVATNVLPVRHLGAGIGALRARRRPDAAMLWRRARELSPEEQTLLVSFVRRPRGTKKRAERADLVREFVVALRHVSDIGEPQPFDGAIGAYLLWQGSPAGRDAYAHELWALGADPRDVDGLLQAFRLLRRNRVGLGRLGVGLEQARGTAT